MPEMPTGSYFQTPYLLGEVGTSAMAHMWARDFKATISTPAKRNEKIALISKSIKNSANVR
jgi:hypothetical protein